MSAIGLLLSSCEKDHSFITDLALNNELIIIPKEQITSRVIVFSNTNWKVEIENPESASWISLSPDEHVTSVNGSGQSYFQFTAKENTSGKIREAIFIIATKNSRKTLMIQQGI